MASLFVENLSFQCFFLATEINRLTVLNRENRMDQPIQNQFFQFFFVSTIMRLQLTVTIIVSESDFLLSTAYLICKSLLDPFDIPIF